MNRRRARIRQRYAGLLGRLERGASLGRAEREDLLVDVVETIDKILDEEPEPDRTDALGIIQSALEALKPRGPDLQAVIETCSRARKGKSTS